MRIPLTQPHNAIRFMGAPDVAYSPEGTRVFRILRKYHPLMPPDLADGCAMASGVRLSFRTTSARVAIGLETLQSGLTGVVSARLDILADNRRALNTTLEPLGTQEAAVDKLGTGLKRIDIYLPQTAPLRLFHIDLDDKAELLPVTEKAPVWITYGSSITHCGDSDGPSTTWSVLVARKLGLNLYNMGFGSNGMMDACAVRTMAEIPADRISLKLAVNTLVGTYNERGFVSAALNMILAIRDRQPDVPILVVSPICFPNGETAPNVVGITLQRMRQLDQEIVERMQKFGDRKISYLDGLKIFGPADAHMLDLPAAIHPNAEAQHIMADRFALAAFGPEGFLKTDSR